MASVSINQSIIYTQYIYIYIDRSHEPSELLYIAALYKMKMKIERIICITISQRIGLEPIMYLTL